jgi:predicted ATP-grasp superfamily ATP-dependent carboligase
MLAELATGAGVEVIALDRFGDLDLRLMCPTPSLGELGGVGGMATLVAAAECIDADAVVYGAGLENRPDLVAQLARGRTLLGNTPDVLRDVRNPELLGGALRSAGLGYPCTLTSPQSKLCADRSRAWLRKPLHSGGGRGIRVWRGGSLSSVEVLQARVRGLACSIVGLGDGRSGVVLGITEQLTGASDFGGRHFAWCGNVVPPRLPPDETRMLEREADAICERLMAAFGLRGLFGVDLVWDGHRGWVVEVNPRPTGSLEVIELTSNTSVFTAHVRAFDGQLPEPGFGIGAGGRAAAKAIVYARRDVSVGNTSEWRARGIKDIPNPGELIRRGHPVCTLIAVAQTAHEALEDLRRRAARLNLELGQGANAGAATA